MAKLFYLSEIIKFAIEKEQESYDLYNRLTKKVTEPKLKDLFEMLKAQETKHKAFYTEMLGNIEEEQTPKVHEDDEYKAFMQELITSSRTAKLESEQIIDALDFALAREKDSILFYIGLKNFVPKNVQNKIDEIIAEETKHTALIAKVIKSI